MSGDQNRVAAVQSGNFSGSRRKNPGVLSPAMPQSLSFGVELVREPAYIALGVRRSGITSRLKWRATPRIRNPAARRGARPGGHGVEDCRQRDNRWCSSVDAFHLSCPGVSINGSGRLAGGSGRRPCSLSVKGIPVEKPSSGKPTNWATHARTLIWGFSRAGCVMTMNRPRTDRPDWH